MGNHSAVDAAVGYYFQGAFALVLLLDQDEEDAAISIETEDDVFLEGTTPTLHQLKHSLHSSSLSEKNDGFWKTLGIWIDYIHQPSFRFHFVTTASIMDGSALIELAAETPCYDVVIEALDAEARRVRDHRTAKIAAGEKPGYDDRWPGCEAYLGLPSSSRSQLIRRIRIMPSYFTAADIEEEVRKRLPTVPHRVRPKVAARITEWWDRQAALSLLKQRLRTIHRSELLAQLHDVVASFHNVNLPDDFSHQVPPDGTQPERNIKRQIDLVEGGARLVKRAMVEHWRARSQRKRWLAEGLPVIDSLSRFDQHLIEEWRDRHDELREKVAAGSEDAASGGRELLEWTHRSAPLELAPMQPGWIQPPHLVRGTYQELAERLTVGWHPDYESVLAQASSDNGDTE